MPHDKLNFDILVVDDEKNMRRVLSAMLHKEGYQPVEAENGKMALAYLEHHTPACIITDLKMPEMDGLELLDRAVQRSVAAPIILITAHGTVDTAVKAMKQGAYDYLTKPFDKAELLNVVRKATRTGTMRRAEPQNVGSLEDFVESTDPSMVEVTKLVDRVSDTDITVLITGESGTGKELIARAVHRQGTRREQPFVAINCAAIPDDLTESELFGYEKGAFTGAVLSKPGRFELADRGTLFLDEVGTLSMKVQGKLLRVLQERSFERVGGIKTLKVDTRLVTATNTDLKEMVENGSFREDLYYRLNVVRIHLPALRDRTADIVPLTRHFIDRFNQKMGKQIEGPSDAALSRLLTYPWPGNIRELENAIERAVLMADGDRIEPADLPPEIDPETEQVEAVREQGNLKKRVRDATMRLERQMILDALSKTGNNVTRAAQMLGLSRKGLQLKMKALELRGDDS